MPGNRDRINKGLVLGGSMEDANEGPGDVLEHRKGSGIDFGGYKMVFKR